MHPYTQPSLFSSWCGVFIVLVALSGCGDDARSSASFADDTPDAADDDPQDNDPDDEDDAGFDDAGFDAPEDAPAPEPCQEDRLGETTRDAPHPLEGDALLSNLVACPERDDWFRLALAPGDAISASAVGTGVALRLVGETGGLIAEGAPNDSGRVGFSHTSPVRRAVFIRVSPLDEVSQTYDLALSLEPAEVDDPDDPEDPPDDCLDTPEEPNESADEAFEIEAPSNFELSTALCEDDEDWYSVTVPAGGTFSARIGFVHDDGDLDMKLYRRGEDEPLATSDSTADEERLTAGPFEGDTELLVEVYGFRGAEGPYTLRTTAFDEPDDTRRLSGEVRYEDRPYDGQGFTGELDALPARYSRVEVIRELDGVVMGQTQTDALGAFAVEFGIHEGQRYQLRALAAATVPGATDDVSYQVRVTDRSSSEAIYAIATEVFEPDALPEEPVSLLAQAEGGPGGAWNIVDVAVTGFEFVARYSDEAAPTLTVSWQAGEAFNCGSCYSDSQISLGGQVEDTDEYDDHIILHEFGHYFVDHFSDDDSPGGPHRDRQVSPVLAYGEGVAYFFCGMVLEDPLVVDTFLDDQRVIDMEAVTQNGQARDDLSGTTDGTLEGNLREEIVAGILWDALDPFDPDEDFDRIEIGEEGHMRLLLDWFGQGLPVDTGPRGIDLSDWLNALYCTFPETEPDVDDLAADREFPWLPGQDGECPEEKHGGKSPYTLRRVKDTLWLHASEQRGDLAEAPGELTLWQGTDRHPAPVGALSCDSLPCPVADLSFMGFKVDEAVFAVTGRDGRGAWLGASWVGAAAAQRLRGGAHRSGLSPLGPVRVYHVKPR